MASGDVVGETDTGTWTFQPSATVEICITQFITQTGGQTVTGKGGILTTNTLKYSTGGGTSNQDVVDWNIPFKIFVNNTNYLEFASGGAYSGYVGIQIK